MGKLNALQSTLPKSFYTRGIEKSARVFQRVGIDMIREAETMMDLSDPREPFVTFEGACGSARTSEEMHQLLSTRRGTRDNVHAIALDIEPQPDLIPPHLLAANGGVPHTNIIQGDLCSMTEIPDGIVKFGWVAAGLQYVEDSLAALEEGHRILADGGVMLWSLPAGDFPGQYVSAAPSFDHIIARTPGAAETFKHITRRAVNGKKRSGIVCRKKEGSGFNGFPYKMILSLKEWWAKMNYQKHKKLRTYMHEKWTI